MRVICNGDDDDAHDGDGDCDPHGGNGDNQEEEDLGLDDNNLEREEVEVESAQLVNNGRTECGQWIPSSHTSLSSKLADTLLVDNCWWKFSGGICLRNNYI